MSGGVEWHCERTRGKVYLTARCTRFSTIKVVERREVREVRGEK